MFDGVPDQFHQFITPRTSLPLHLSFPLHASAAAPSNSFPPFDPYNPSPHQLPLQLQPNLLHPLHHQPSTHKDEAHEKEENSTVPMNFEIERDQRQLPELIDPWTNDEVLALLRIRSSMESWFPELTWEHVSRKLGELGYKRSAEKCKEKFEEESRYFNINYGKNNFRFLSELEELYQGGGDHQVEVETEKTTHTQQLEKPASIEGQDKIIMGRALEECSRNVNTSETKQNEQGDHDEVVTEKTKDRPKRKRPDHRFEMFKGFCESIVHKMMAQQEEMHNKLLKDMVKRDEEKFAKEEAWKKQEMDRMNQELEMMAQEQAIAGDRQANIIEFLNKFSSSSPSSQSFINGSGGNIGNDKIKVTNGSNPPNTCCTPSSPLHSQNPNPSTGESILQPTPPSSTVLLNHLNTGTSAVENPSSSPAQDTIQIASSTSFPTLQNPSSSLNMQNNPLETNYTGSNYKASSNLICTEKDGVGKRWPKDEVLALINLRCNSLNNNNNEDIKEGNKAPLWERISQGMLELGYERSAKRCKEKWENINKYFRKTKDVNKKRSLDSRTCPYFHQLSNLYNQGKLVLQSERPENHLSPPANHGQVTPDQTQLAESSQVGSGGFGMQDDHGGEKTLMQVPSLDFDQF